MFLLLTLNIFHFFSSVFIVDFKQVHVSWVTDRYAAQKLRFSFNKRVFHLTYLYVVFHLTYLYMCKMADFLTFTEEMLEGGLYFLCCVAHILKAHCQIWDNFWQLKAL